MASTPTNPTGTEHGRRTPEELERARSSTIEHLHQASAEVDKARQQATGAVRGTLDNALERLRQVSGELRQRAADQTAEWQDALEQAPDKVRREMARRAIRAQRSPEALKDLSAEIRKREADLKPPAQGDGAKD